jgi:hypothetical protein
MYLLNNNEVQTYDVSDKAHPSLVHKLTLDYGLETIVLYDNSLFIGSTTALYILNLSNPAAPTLQAKTERIEISESSCDPVVVKGNYAYSTIKIIENICGTISDRSALLVYDVSDKSNPELLSIKSLNIPNGLGYKDNYLFVCDEGFDQLLVFDISNPAMAIETNLSIPLSDPVDIIVDGDRMIVSTKTDFQVYDVSDIANLRIIGQISK